MIRSDPDCIVWQIVSIHTRYTSKIDADCAWVDAHTRSRIVYPGSGNHSDFTYDGLGRNVKILEYTASSLTSTKQFVYCGNARSESRDASSSVTAQYCVFA